MTPEERAQAVAEGLVGREGAMFDMWVDIAAAIRQAVAEEREACARLMDAKAEGWAALAKSEVLDRPQPPITPRELIEARQAEAQGCASAIRARTA